MEQPFNAGDKVQTSLGAIGTVEVVEIDKDGQPIIKIRWKSGALGAYTREDVKRYGVKKA